MTEPLKIPLTGVIIRNFGALGKQAPLQVDFKKPVTVISGKNASGKTSFANAVRGAICASQDPMNIGKTAVAEYSGGAKAPTVIEAHWSSGGRSTWHLGTGVAHEGEALQIPEIIGGIMNPVTMYSPTRAQELWDNIFVVRLTIELVLKKVDEVFANMPASMTDRIKLCYPGVKEFLGTEDTDHDPDYWTRLMQDAKVRAENLRGQIVNLIPNESISSRKKAQTLYNDLDKVDYVDHLDDPEEDITRLDNLYKELRRAEEAQKYSKARVVNEKIAAEIEEHLTELEKHKASAEAQDERKAKRQKLISSREALDLQINNLRSHADGFPCPSCKTMLLFNSVEKRFDPAGDTEAVGDSLDELLATRKDVDGRIKKLISSIDQYDNIQRSLESEYNRARGEQKAALKFLEQSDIDPEAPVRETGDIQQDIQEMNEKLREYNQQKKTATSETINHGKDLAIEMMVWETLTLTLAPGGLRKELKHNAIEKLNKDIKLVSEKCGMALAAPQINPDTMLVNINRRSAKLASESERFMAQVMFQCVFLLRRANHDIVAVIDGADILGTSKKIANSFYKLLSLCVNKHRRVSFLVTSTDFKGAYAKDCLDGIEEELVEVVEF